MADLISKLLSSDELRALSQACNAAPTPLPAHASLQVQCPASANPTKPKASTLVVTARSKPPTRTRRGCAFSAAAANLRLDNPAWWCKLIQMSEALQLPRRKSQHDRHDQVFVVLPKGGAGRVCLGIRC